MDATQNAQPEQSAESTDPAERLQKISRDYFPPAKLVDAESQVAEVLEVCEANKIKPVYNFDTDKDFPEGYGLAILPIKTRHASRGNVVTGMAIVALPDPVEVEAHDKGKEFIRNCVIDAELAKVANAVRPRSDGSTAASVPYTVEDFITSARAAESLAAFRELAPSYVKALKKQKMSIMTATILRQVLSSAQFAAQQFPTVAAEKWEGVLDKMIARAKSKGLEPGIMDHWKETRATSTVEMGDFDLDGLEGLMDEDEDEESAA